MAEANEAEPNERAAPSPRRPRRKHVISLCCAQSVHRVVEEVARNLEGLGFHTTVVTGAEARAALLGSRTDSEQPTIHVVCVQGSMQERVLKPLRQALATHGGPNHHLFVAVLDLGVPLAMVGQIRRFAEALERPASGSHAAAIAGGRDGSALRDLEQSPTRSYPSVAQVVERGGTKPPVASEGEDAGERSARRGRPLGARPRVAKIGPTSKYQAVTASNAEVPAETGVRKRRRARSRMSPAAQRRASDERVLGLPEPEQSREPLAASREPQQPPPLQPPPPPPPGELARRRGATTLPTGSSTPPPPPLTKTPSSTSLPAAGSPGLDRETTPYLRWAGGKPPEPGAAKDEGSAEPDRATPRPGGFRFTPPGVKGAGDERPQGGPVSSVPLSEVLSDPDKTRVEGVLAEVPRTASTLRLDEPPFGDGSKPRGGRDGASRNDDEPVEPTMILAAPREPSEAEVEELEAKELVPSEPAKGRAASPKPVPPASIVGASPLPPAATGTTVVGPPPKPAPEVLAELERVRREAGAAASTGPGTPAGPRKTFGYLEREERAPQAGPSERARMLVSESSRTLVHPPVSSAESSGTLVLRARTAVTVDDEEILSDSASTLVQRPRSTGAAEPSAGASATLVLRPRPGEAKPGSESSGTMVLRPRSSEPVGGSESSGTMVLRPRSSEPVGGSETSGTLRPRLGGARPGSESSGTMRPRLGDAGRGEGPSGTVVQPAPTRAAEVSESEKTLLRSDGTFESSRELMQKIEASRRSQAPAPSAATPGTKAAEAPAPAPRGDARAAFKAGKTVLYADSSAVPLPTKPAEDAQGGTVVGPPPTGVAAKPAATGSEQRGTVVTSKPSAATGQDAAARPPAAAPSSDQGGTVVTSKPAPEAKQRISEPDAPVATTARSPSGRKLPPSAVPTERHPLAEVDPDAKPSRRSRGKKRAVPRSSEPPSSRSGVLVGESPAPSTREQPRPRDAAARPRTKPKASGYGWLWIMLALLTAGGGWGAYQAGLLDDLLGRRSSSSTVADAGTSRPTDASTASDAVPRTSAGEAGAAEADGAGADAAEAGNAEAGAAEAGNAEAGNAEAGNAEAGNAEAGAAEAGNAESTGPDDPAPKAETGDDDPTSTGAPPDPTTGAPEPAADSGTPDQPADTRGPEEPAADSGTPEPPPSTGDEPEPTPGDGPRLSAEEQQLTPAVDQRRIFMLKTLYTTRRQGDETTFGGAWQRCAKLEVDGVKGWRLPHRREMKLVNAVLSLPSGVYWTRTVPGDDKSSAYVLDTNDGSLALFLKSEPIGDVVCVRERDFPEK